MPYVYISLDGDNYQWYQSLPPRGKGGPINDAIRRGREAQTSSDSLILRRLSEVLAKLDNIGLIEAKGSVDPTPDDNDDLFDGWVSMVDD